MNLSTGVAAVEEGRAVYGPVQMSNLLMEDGKKLLFGV